ncbi:MAG: tryptophan synthase subunit alpha [Dehalococcoidia bacterium]|nr:tryptophan synthase subunit alpha [Dehalococcoidia bacterium]
MTRIASVFNRAGHKALVAYVTAGYPSMEDTLKVVPLLAGNGCDIVELGIPFSDPLADGATIQRASFCALKNGVTPKLCLKVAKEISQKVDIPLVFMTYFNPIFSYGLEEFCSDCAGAGVGGLVIPDLPPDEGSELELTTQRHSLDLIYLLAPTSAEERIKLVADRARGFIYLVSVTGVTGTRDNLPPELGTFVDRVRSVANQPLCVGFGISTPEQARQVSRIADGVIVGSRIIQLMEAGDLESVGDFIKELRHAMDKEG